MRVRTQPRLGGHAFVDQLLLEGVTTVFCVPGESYLAVLDGLHDASDDIRLVTARHEGGAAMMALAHGKLTGRPGVCMVTRGPGATNASIGVHMAHQDSVPMVVVIGQVATADLGHRAFQEIDYPRMFAPLAKEVMTVLQPEQIPAAVSRAFAIAVSGEPGPVVMVLPEDVTGAATDAPPVPVREVVETVPADGVVDHVVELLSGADRPLIVVGGPGWTAEARGGLQRFAESTAIPVATGVRQQDLIDNRSRAYAGTLGLATSPGLGELAATADVVVMIGARPDALTAADHHWLAPGPPGRTLVQVHPGADVIGSAHPVDVAIACAVAPFVRALEKRSDSIPAREEIWLQRGPADEVGVEPAPRSPAAFMAVANRVLPADCVMTAGAGAYTAWPQRHHDYVAHPSQVASQTGAMGFGLPAAVAAKLAMPERTVVAWAGDGCFLMTGQELATVVREDLDIIVVVVNNSRLGTIREHQDRRFPGRVSGTELTNPDFAALARSFGVAGRQVTEPEEFGIALSDALASDGPTLIEVIID